MDPKAIAEVYRQIIMGGDIPAPASMLKGLKPERAAERLPGFPYSLLENLWHAVFWQTIWLNRLEGKKAKSFMEDWQSPEPSELPKLRARFLANLAKAHKIASAKSFKHKMKSDEAALKTLVAMAVHDSYHIGQMNLIKRATKFAGQSRK